MATSKHTYTRVEQCSHASVGLAQARPNEMGHERLRMALKTTETGPPKYIQSSHPLPVRAGSYRNWYILISLSLNSPTLISPTKRVFCYFAYSFF